MVKVSELKKKNYWNQILEQIELNSEYSAQNKEQNQTEKLVFSLDNKKFEQVTKNIKEVEYVILLSVFHILLKKKLPNQTVAIWTPFIKKNEKASLMPTFSAFNEGTNFKEFVSIFQKQLSESNKMMMDVKKSWAEQLGNNFEMDYVFSFDQIQDEEKLMSNQSSLALKFAKSESGFLGELIFDKKQYPIKSMMRFIEHYKHLINMVLNYPEKNVLHHSLVKDLDEIDHLKNISSHSTLVETPKNLHHIFKEKAVMYSENIALECGTENLTYSELDALSDKVASNLKVMNFKRGDLVGVLMKPSIDTYIVLMGIIKAGCAYIPISLNTPVKRIEYILENSGAEGLISSQQNLENLRFKGKVLHSEMLFKDVVDSGSDTDHTPSDLMYVIYTSGTTGDPKGVKITHENAFNTLSYLKDEYPLKAEDSFLWKTSYSFDVSIGELFGWFWNGGSLSIPKQETLKEPQEIVDCIVYYGITHLNFTPTLLRLFVNALTPAAVQLLKNNLKYIFVAGEAFELDLALKVKKMFGDQINVINLYGPTEASIYATGYQIDESITKMYIGKPIRNMKSYILDEANNVLPIGYPGTLYLAGPGVAEGYLNNSKLTQLKFVEDIYNPAEIMYCTGDIAQWEENGNIEFIGRQDDQIKFRGLRVELGEIEQLIKRIEGVEDAIVLANDESKDLLGKMCAFVVTHNLTEMQIKEFLKDRLMEYMIPNYIVVLDKMPLGTSGKIDKKRLPSPIELLRNHDQKIERNMNPIEEKLSEIWMDILNIKNVYINDNFFDLGAHSLSILELINEVDEKMGINLNFESVYKNPVLFEMARFLNSKKNGKKLSLEMMKQKYFEEFQEKFNTESVLLDERRWNVLFTDKSKHSVLAFIAANNPDYLPHYIFSIKENTDVKNQAAELIKKKLSQSSDYLNSELVDVINYNYNSLSAKFTNATIEKEFNCGVKQYDYIKHNFNSVVAQEIKINECIDVNDVLRALENVIALNPLLRSYIVMNSTKLSFVQRESFKFDQIQIFDATALNNKNQKLLVKKTTEILEEFLKKQSIESLMFHFALIKLNETEYKLLFMANHLIFDGYSKKVFEYDFLNMLQKKEIKKKNTYETFAALLWESSSDQVVESFLLSDTYLNFKTASDELENKYPDFKKPIVFSEPISFSIPFKETSSGNSDESMFLKKEKQLLSTVVEWCHEIFEMSQIPVRILSNGRKFSNQEFYDVIGDCHTSYPVLFKQDCTPHEDYQFDELESVKTEFQKNKWELSAVYRYAEKKDSPEIEHAIDRAINFNYIGEITEESETEILKDIKNENFARFPIMGYTKGNELGITFFNGVPDSFKKKLKNNIIEKFSKVHQLL